MEGEEENSSRRSGRKIPVEDRGGKFPPPLQGKHETALRIPGIVQTIYRSLNPCGKVLFALGLDDRTEQVVT